MFLEGCVADSRRPAMRHVHGERLPLASNLSPHGSRWKFESRHLILVRCSGGQDPQFSQHVGRECPHQACVSIRFHVFRLCVQLMNGPLQRVSQGKSLRVIHGGRTLLENDLSLQAAGIRDKAYVHCMVTGAPPTLPSPAVPLHRQSVSHCTRERSVALLKTCDNRARQTRPGGFGTRSSSIAGL